jgi:hypothetical protein
MKQHPQQDFNLPTSGEFGGRILKAYNDDDDD